MNVSNEEKLISMVEKLKDELYCAVGFINDNLAKDNKDLNKDEKHSYMNMQTILDADILLSKIKKQLNSN